MHPFPSSPKLRFGDSLSRSFLLSLKPTWLIFQQSHKYTLPWGRGFLGCGPNCTEAGSCRQPVPSLPAAPILPFIPAVMHPPARLSQVRPEAAAVLTSHPLGTVDGMWHFDSLTRARWWPRKEFAASHGMSPVGLDPKSRVPKHAFK